MRLIIDLETDNLLYNVSTIHCVSVVDVDSSYSELFINDGNGRIGQFLEMIDDPTVELIGHNIYNFDLKVIEKLYGWKPYKEQIITDTFLLAQILFPDIDNEDHLGTHGAAGKVFGNKEKGSHSLRAWGQRCKVFKGEYTGGFKKYNDEMGKYCIGDTYTTKALLQFLESKIDAKLLTHEPLDIENSIAPILARQQSHGVLFDRKKAEELFAELQAKLVDLKWDLQDVFKPKYISLGIANPKRSQCRNGQQYTKDAEYTRIKLQEFNPSSRQQIVSRLVSQFGWNPEEFTDKGNAKMGEEIIDNLPFIELKPLKEYLQIKMLMGKLMTAKGSWVNKCDDDNRIRGGVLQNGAITGRMSHFSPNFNIPSEKKLYGKECRELFIAPKGKVLVGVDADALEMRVLAGYMAKLDQGRMIASVLQGDKALGTDPHSLNMEAYGIVGYADNARDLAKTLFYGDVYGAGNAKKGKILLDYGVKLDELVPNFDREVNRMVLWVDKKNKDEGITGRNRSYWECWVAGKYIMEQFGDKMPELKELKERIKNKIEKDGYIKGLDGRKLYSRSPHGQLNTVAQAAGAIIMKKAQYICDKDLQDAGLIPGQDYEFVLTIHDEWLFEVTEDDKIVDTVKKIAENSINKAAFYFKFPCEMKGNGQVGSNWYEVH